MKSLIKIAAVGAVASIAIGTLYGAPKGYSGEAAAIKGKMAEDHRYTLGLRAKAVKDKDIIRLNCINDKLVVMLPKMNIADRLLGRIDGSDEKEQESIFKDLQEAANGVREQREAATNCADTKLVVTESSNTYNAPDLDMPTDPLPEAPPLGYVEPAGYASPPGQ